MRFVMDIDLDLVAGDATEELGRALRYWAGNLKHYELAEGTTEAVMDSAYTAVGTWEITR
ncbi:hypothetical protein GCM10025865_15080 [Paraoerskovia sediminicola]|uniref:Uncharacterized protein n=1 Tax=Paraoerskovia sediminicola TaxID=1138587 RepID=A0ABM8G2B4_9CELL|nr:hypothetical protein GCM10025865_15080 [Paraoerskovia sediminicola]